MIVAFDDAGDCSLLEGVKIGFSREAAAQASDGIFDAAFLPWRSDVAKESLDADLCCELVMEGEFRPVIEGYGAAHGLWQGFEHVGQMSCGSLCLSVLWSMDDRKARGAFMGDQDGLAILGKEHEIGFPMA